MPSFRFPRTTFFGSACAFALILLPVGIAYAADSTADAPLAYDLSVTDAPIAAVVPATEPAPAEVAIDERSLECMAKVVHHESRGQPRKGQLAVAQTLINRLKLGGRFGNSVCAIANQPGQYFNTSAYQPRRDTDDWQMALDVSRETLAGSADSAAPGALFFHAAYRTPSSFFRTRQRVASIGGQVFYR